MAAIPRHTAPMSLSTTRKIQHGVSQMVIDLKNEIGQYIPPVFYHHTNCRRTNQVLYAIANYVYNLHRNTLTSPVPPPYPQDPKKRNRDAITVIRDITPRIYHTQIGIAPNDRLECENYRGDAILIAARNYIEDMVNNGTIVLHVQPNFVPLR